MPRELKVYNRFHELILYLRFVPKSLFPLQVVLGSRELREAVRALYGQDFDRTVVVEGEHRNFRARWASPEYIDALAGYWGTNFQWRTETKADELPIDPKSSGLVPTDDSLGLGGDMISQPVFAGSLAYPYSTGLAIQSKPQGDFDPYLPHHVNYDSGYPPACALLNGNLEVSLSNARFPYGAGRPILSTAVKPAEPSVGLAIGMVSQGGSAYGATFSSPG